MHGPGKEFLCAPLPCKQMTDTKESKSLPKIVGADDLRVSGSASFDMRGVDLNPALLIAR